MINLYLHFRGQTYTVCVWSNYNPLPCVYIHAQARQNDDDSCGKETNGCDTFMSWVTEVRFAAIRCSRVCHSLILKCICTRGTCRITLFELALLWDIHVPKVLSGTADVLSQGWHFLYAIRISKSFVPLSLHVTKVLNKENEVVVYLAAGQISFISGLVRYE